MNACWYGNTYGFRTPVFVNGVVVEIALGRGWCCCCGDVGGWLDGGGERCVEHANGLAFRRGPGQRQQSGPQNDQGDEDQNKSHRGPDALTGEAAVQADKETSRPTNPKIQTAETMVFNATVARSIRRLFQ